jgi:K+-transporting ATPase KdpF subunit
VNVEPGWVVGLAALLAAGLFAYLLYALIDAEHLQ